MSYESCAPVRARKGARRVGVFEYRVPPVVYRGGWPLGMQLCVYVLCTVPLSLSTHLDQNFTNADVTTPEPHTNRLLHRTLEAGGSINKSTKKVFKSLVQAPNAPRDQSQHPRASSDYDEETAYESYMNPEPGFQSGPGDAVDAD